MNDALNASILIKRIESNIDQKETERALQLHKTWKTILDNGLTTWFNNGLSYEYKFDRTEFAFFGFKKYLENYCKDKSTEEAIIVIKKFESHNVTNSREVVKETVYTRVVLELKYQHST